MKSCDFAFGSCDDFSVEEACELRDENGLSDDSFMVSDPIRAVEIHRVCCQCRVARDRSLRPRDASSGNPKSID